MGQHVTGTMYILPLPAHKDMHTNYTWFAGTFMDQLFHRNTCRSARSIGRMVGFSHHGKKR
jgi:hypothetical protein